MTREESAIAFKLIDDYSRSNHSCFIAEFFKAKKDDSNYLLCFRPAAISKESPNRYACRYLHIEDHSITQAIQRMELPIEIRRLLDAELSSLGLLT